mgnify:CR=1 FL=1
MSKNPWPRLGDRLTKARMRLKQTRRQQAAELTINPRTLARWVAGTHFADPTSQTGIILASYLKRMGV